MMRKVVIVLVLCGFVISCGPRRLGCGPGRCDVAKQVKNIRQNC